ERWDWTEQGVYTLSDRTIAVLEGLNQPVEIWVLVSEVEPGFGELRNVLGRYGAESEFVEVEYVDPDRDPGRYREAATRFGLGSNTLGSAQGPDVAVVVVAGGRQWEVRRTDLFQEDYSDVLDDEGQVTLNVDGERAITGALVELMSGHATKVCVVSGHGEFQVSGSGRSLTGFAAEMRRENLEMESIETRGMTRIDDECDAVAVIGPEVALTQAEASLLRRYVREGGNLLVALDPIPNPDQTALVSMGVDGMLRELGVRVDRTIVIEPNPALLPAGGGHPIGPFAVVGWGDHPITEPFGDMGLALVVSEVRSVRLMSEERGTVLLTTSEQSYAESNLASLSAGPTDLMPDAEDFEGPVPIAVALQVEVLGEDETGDDDEEEAAAARPHGGRLVVIGDATLFASEYLQQDTVVNRSFASGVMGWLTERDALLAIEARTIERQPFTMSQDDIVNLFLRVVVLIPLAFIFLGIAVWWNRRN
ncbi:MAG: GldG family protein, partial [Sandaracinaceae bacterium]